MSTKSFQCRWAFLSLSGIAEKFIRDLSLPRSPSNPITHQLVAISTTRSVERAREWLAHQEVVNHQGITIYTSYEEMLKAGDFDVVYISTPHHLHFQQASVALQYSCNILLEKPAVMNQGQLKRLYELAKKHDAVLMEAMWTRYFPLTHYFQQDILPQVGAIKRIFADFSVPIFGDPNLPASSRFSQKSRALDPSLTSAAILSPGSTWL